MKFFRRGQQGESGEGGVEPSQPSPPAPPALKAVEANGRVYARGTCPHCEAPIVKPPLRSGKCSSCGERFAYVRGADDLVYLARESDADPIRAEAEAHYQLSRTWTGKPDVDALRRYTRVFLARYAALGLLVWTRHGDDSCAECRALHGRLLNPTTAPDLPLRGCRRLYCFCRYSPTLGEEPPPEDRESHTVQVEVI